jgi:hypothetical protein
MEDLKLKEVRYNKDVYYYIQPWDKKFYKNTRYELVSEKQFIKKTNITFELFYKKHCIENKKEIKLTIEQYMIEHLNLIQPTVDYCNKLLSKLSINTLHMSYKKVVALLINKNLVKPKYIKYIFYGCKQNNLGAFAQYILGKKQQGIILELPTYSMYEDISKICSINNNITYELYL